MTNPPGTGAPLVWRTSSYSGNTGGQCIQVALPTTSGQPCHVRDSKDTTGPTLTFTPRAWHAFTTALQAGDPSLPG
jgi:hypothetical protein